MGHVSKRPANEPAPRRAGVLAAALAASACCGTAAAGLTAFGLTGEGNLVRFDTDSPGTIQGTTTLTGVGADETLLGIDFRPAAAGQLYGLSSFGQLYQIDAASGAATAVGPALTPEQAPLEGRSFGFDFNPVVDRIRVNSDLGENLRLNPDTGALGAVDGMLAYAAGDVNEGELSGVTAAAYTNSDTDPATATTLYGIDSAFGTLVTQDPPNAGTLNTVGSLGVDEATLIGGFDIFGADNQAFAASTGAPADFGPALPATLYAINLATGAATAVGQIGDGSLDVVGLALAAPGAAPNPIPLPSALLAFPLGAAVAGIYHRRMRRGRPA